MSHRRSSQPQTRGIAALSAQSEAVAKVDVQAAAADCMGSWRQWQPQRLAGHRTLRIELARHFHQHGCKAYGA